MLPEVNRREITARTKGKSLLAKKGFSLIFVFAAKLAGMSEEQVRIVLNLERKLEDKPKLHKLLVSGEVSANKLVRIASIATSLNDNDLAEKARILSQAALETHVREQKIENQNGLLKTKNEPESLRAHSKVQDTSQDVRLIQKLSPELKQKLLELDEKGLDINEMLLELLQKRDDQIAEEKEKLAAPMRENNKKPSRYIPIRIKKIIHQEHGTKCSHPNCHKPGQHIHHTLPFAIHKTHNPHHLKPLCKAHHELAHQNDAHVQKFRQASLAT